MCFFDRIIIRLLRGEVFWLRKLLVALSLLLVLFTVSCVRPQYQTGSLTVKIVTTKLIPSAEPVVGVVTLRKGERTLFQSFDCSSQSSVTFQSIEQGTWNVYVELKDSEGYTIYTGETQAEVIAKAQNTVSVTVTLNSADLKVEVTVASSEASSVKFEAFLTGEAISDLKDLQDGNVVFEFSKLSSAVWNARLTLYDRFGKEMLVWPESGLVGLELQPGRTNTYHITVDLFGDVTVNIEIENASTVSSATFVNVEEGISISWDPVEGASLYEIYKKEQDYWIKIYEGTATSYVDEDVVENVEYCYVFNVVNVNGRHSGFSNPFRILRDTRRVFVGLSDGTVVRLKLEVDPTAQFTPVASKVVTQSANDIKLLYTLNNDLYVLMSNKLLRLNVDSLELLSQYQTWIFSEGTSIFKDSYFFQLGGSELRKYQLPSFSFQSVQIDGTYLAVDRFVLALKYLTDVHLIDFDNLQILSTNAMPSAVKVFTHGNFAFVLTCPTSYQLEMYSINNNNLELVRTYTVDGNITCFDATDQVFFVGIYNKGLYIGRIDDGTLVKLTSDSPVAIKVVQNMLYVLFKDRLELYSFDSMGLTVTSITSYNFGQDATALFVD